MNSLKKGYLSLTEKGRLKIQVNTLENENETLKNAIKDELYKIFMEKLEVPAEMELLKKENKTLRKKIKVLKDMLKEDQKEWKKNARKKG